MFPTNSNKTMDVLRKSSPTDTEDVCMDNRALKMMEKMGYINGLGLGKTNQGLIKPVEVSNKDDRKGFGFKKQQSSVPENFNWDSSSEIVNVKEEVKWIKSSSTTDSFYLNDLKTWAVYGQQNLDECRTGSKFCDADLQSALLQAKTLLELLEPNELRKVRTRCNPFESIRNVFFLNRAALKMSNIDAACDFMFTNIDQDKHHFCPNKPYYFADVCAGPGGFSEYILWRKKWLFKGFGFTLRGDNDFTLNNFFAGSPETFQVLYGTKQDGNIYEPANIVDFKEKVLSQTDNQGVHFMMSDGGFSVEGQEDLQEFLSKRLYLCQCLVALSIVRPNGHFVTKLFDTFTLFTVGLLYLMYHCFEEVSIFKPNASRPANSERYFICKRRKANIELIRNYLQDVNNSWNCSDLDLVSLVPIELIKSDSIFNEYLIEVNNSLCKRQISSLNKIIQFSQDMTWIDPRQNDLKLQCLQYWNLPNTVRTQPVDLVPEHFINNYFPNKDFLNLNSIEISTENKALQILSKTENWKFCLLTCSDKMEYKFYLGCGGTKIYQYENGKWVLTTFNLELPRGSLLLAEVVKEIFRDSQKKVKHINCLHVIDALQLGDSNIHNVTFEERRNLIQIFCEALNQPYNLNTINIRIKPVFSLSQFTTLNQPYRIVNKKGKEEVMYDLPVMCNVSTAFFPGYLFFFKQTPILEHMFTKCYHCVLTDNVFTNRAGFTWTQLNSLFIDIR